MLERAGVERAAIVGLGPMGLRHLAAWRRALGPDNVLAVVRHDGDRRRLERAGLADTPTVTAASELAGRVDIAVVCVPTPAHAAVAEPLLQAGLAALVEKPLAGRLEDARRLLHLPGRAFVAHTCRAESGCSAVFSALAGHRVQRIHSARAERPRRLPEGTPPQARHGRLFDVLVHDIGAVLQALPSAPPSDVSVAWDAASQRLDATLSWPDLRLTIVQERAASTPSRRVELEPAPRADPEAGGGSAGWLVAPGTADCWVRVPGLAHGWDQHRGARDPLDSLCAAVVHALDAGIPSPFDAEHGVRTMALAAAVLRALPEGTFGDGRFDWSFVR